jgi:hypothetical protein
MGQGWSSNSPSSSGGVQSVTGLNTDNTDPLNPIVDISVDGVTITGDGTPANPLVGAVGGGVQSVTGLNTDNIDPLNPIVQVSVDGITITGDGTPANPLVSVGSDKGSFGGGVGYITIPYSGTITGWQVIGDISGNCVFDVWKSASGIIPTVANTITGTEKPTLIAQQINSDLALTTWTTSVTSGDIVAIVLDSASILSQAWLTVFITKT